MKMLGIYSLINLIHIALLIYLTVGLYQINTTLQVQLVAIEILLTILIQIINANQSQRNWKQLLYSLSLIYALRPTDIAFFKYLFLVKIFYIQKTLAQVSNDLLGSNFKIFRLLKTIFDFVKITLGFYMFLGIIVVVYKYWAYLWTDPQKTLSTSQLMYYFMITSSSIGYGDFTPKNDYQIYFSLTFIPIFILSFGVYIGQVISQFDSLMQILSQSNSSLNQIISQSIWTKQTKNHFTSYINHIKQKNKSMHEHENASGSWISIACKNYDQHQPLLMQIFDNKQSKQYKMLVSSKLKKVYFPQNWTILAKNNYDDHLYLIQQGQIKTDEKTLIKGDTFNLNGFLNKQPSNQNYITTSIVSLWAINTQQLEQISRQSISLQNKIAKKVSKVQENYHQIT